MKERGQLIISIDYEYALGFADYALGGKEKELIRDEVAITHRVIDLFEKYEISATWAVVGHLLETKCSWNGGIPHPEYDRPIHRGETQDWFLYHPNERNQEDVLWFDSGKLISKISRSPVGHEIASHSYGHVMYGSKEGRKESVVTDLKNMKRVHLENDLPVSTFIFPRNKEGYRDLLKGYDIKCYRGTTSRWYQKFPSIVGRAFRLLDYFLPIIKTVKIKKGMSGLVNIPDSLFFMGRGGLRKIIPARVMEWKLKLGIKKAIERGETFHLWFHPSNFCRDRETQFAIFENVLIEADRLRKAGGLHIVTMRQAAESYEATSQ